MKKNKVRNSRNKTSRALLWAGILCLSSTLGGLATATYAWFDLVSSASIDQIQLNFGNAPDLELGLKEEGGKLVYSRSWDDASLAALSPNYVPFAPLGEVSSMYQSSWYQEGKDVSSFFPLLYEPFYASQDPSSTPIAKSGYFQCELYFRSDRNLYLFLDESTSIAPLRALNQKRAEELNSQNGTSLKGSDLDEVTHAVRVSFLSDSGFFILSPTGEEGATYGGVLDLDGDGYYDSKEGKEILYGDYSGTPFYGEPLEEDSSSPASPSSFSAKHQAGVKPFLEEASLEQGFAFQQEKAYKISDLSLDKNASYFDPQTMTPIAHLKANEPTRVVFSLYCEGWDPHCKEGISSGAFSLNLSFTGLEAAK